MIEIPDFLKPLERLTRPFPEAAVGEVAARKEEATPHLLAVLTWTVESADQVWEDYELSLPTYAFFLLAEFRETRAYETMIALARHPRVEDFLGDVVTDGLGPILASVSGGEVTPVLRLVQDRDANEWARSAGLSAVGAMCAAGMIERAELSEICGRLFSGGLEREESHVWNELGAVCADFRLAEHKEAIRAAFQEDLLDPSFDPLESIEAQLIKKVEMDEMDAAKYRLVESTVDEMGWWDWFRPRAEADDDFDNDDFDGEDEDEDDLLRGTYAPDPSGRVWATSETPYIRETPKIGRNEPCPCGSGKKYKKCCGG